VQDHEPIPGELPHDALTHPPQFDDLLSDERIDRWRDRAKQKRTRQPHAQQPLPEDPWPERVEIGLDVWQFRHVTRTWPHPAAPSAPSRTQPHPAAPSRTQPHLA
jgi:hypothetical protein